MKENKTSSASPELKLSIMTKLFILFEFQHTWRLPLRHINSFVYRLYEFVFTINEFTSSKISPHNPVCQKYCFFRARFFTQSAKDTAQHIDFIYRSIFFFPV